MHWLALGIALVCVRNASDVVVASACLAHAKCLRKKADIVILCEVHPRDDWIEDLDLSAYATWMSKKSN